MFRVRVRGEDRITGMARALDNAPDYLRQDLGVAIRRAARPTLAATKRAIETNPIRGFRSGKRRYSGPSDPKRLRRRIAAAVHVEINTGTLSPRAQFVVRTREVGAGRVPEYIEAGRRWRHPIMGNRKAWASSQGKPWFETTVEKHRPLFERRVNEALNSTARRIERSA